MIIRVPIIISFAIYTIFTPIVAYTPPCNQTCAGHNQITKLPFPFGFTSGCPIHINCTPNGTASINEFQVQTLTADKFLVDLPAKCDRSITALRHLFGRNFAPTSQNGILLQNCTSSLAGCFIPTTTVQTRFELLNCSSNSGNMSCYSEQIESLFINYENLTRSGCSKLFSAISSETLSNSTAISLDVQVVHMGWWLEGDDCKCSENSNCIEIVSPTNGRRGYRCRCLDGFVGDGYREGLGCRKASSKCNPGKFISGKCGGGATQVGVLVGGVAAGACLLVSLGLLCCCYFKKRSNTNTRKTTKRRLCEATGITIPIYPYKDIERATDSFSENQQLGTGAFGTVYSGKLDTNDLVAIKRIKYRDTDSTEQVLNEIKLISSVNHPNLVRLLGCSIDKGEQILIYEFMPNGTLSQHLQRARGDGLTWQIRLTIAVETAQAIAHLHSALNPPIYHRDIKSSNILLDYDFKSKLADFGLSRLGMTDLSHISTAPQGTPGYLDPQYHQNFQLSDKSDVYSFGVVLVEIITGLKAVDFTRPQNDVNLASLAIDRIGKGRLEEIIDSFLEPHSDPLTFPSVHKVAELAFKCLAFHRDMRPSMMEVAAELEQIRLSRGVLLEENIIYSSKSSFSSSLSISEKPLSIKDRWPSEQSSQSSSSFPSHSNT